MSEENKESDIKQTIDENQIEVKRLIDDIKKIKLQTEDHLKAAETSRRAADEHASYANQAKINTEEHSKATASFKGTAEADFNSIAANKQKSDELLAALTHGKADIDANVKTISERRKDFEQITEELIKTTKADLLNKINELLTKATADQEKFEGILNKLTKSHETACEFENRVIKSSADLDSLIKRTESLLPGVTSASLASAFATHKKRFAVPKWVWLCVFILCIGGLIGVATPSFVAAVSDKLSDKTWADIFRCFVMRLPIVIPLVWLGIYAGRNYMLSIRLEEDYAYKEAISMAFEGYKREMKGIDGEQSTGSDKPITILCENVLKAIAERPGRIYEGKQQDITLQNEALEIATKATDLSKKQISKG